MYVSLHDYRFYVAAHDDNGTFVLLLVSRTEDASYVQVTRLTPEGVEVSVKGVEASAQRLVPVVTGDLVTRLEATGAVVLEDVRFAPGASALETTETDSLAELAAYLLADPGRRIVLVGHTDGVGGLSGNIALSKRRA